MGKDQQAQWYIQLVGSRPPEINLFSSNSESYLRYGTKGVFTKKKIMTESILKDLNQDVFKEQIVDIINELHDSSEQAFAEEKSFIIQESTALQFSSLQREIRKKIQRRIKTINSALDKALKQKISSDDIIKYEKNARILQTYSYLVKNGDKLLKLDSHNSEYQTPFEIEIDPNVSIGINIQKLYEKAKKAKRSIGKQTEQIKKLEKKLDDLNSHHHRLEVENVDDEVLYSLVEKLKLSTQKNS